MSYQHDDYDIKEYEPLNTPLEHKTHTRSVEFQQMLNRDIKNLNAQLTELQSQIAYQNTAYKRLSISETFDKQFLRTKLQDIDNIRADLNRKHAHSTAKLDALTNTSNPEHQQCMQHIADLINTQKQLKETKFEEDRKKRLEKDEARRATNIELKSLNETKRNERMAAKQFRGRGRGGNTRGAYNSRGGHNNNNPRGGHTNNNNNNPRGGQNNNSNNPRGGQNNSNNNPRNGQNNNSNNNNRNGQNNNNNNPRNGQNNNNNRGGQNNSGNSNNSRTNMDAMKRIEVLVSQIKSNDLANTPNPRLETEMLNLAHKSNITHEELGALYKRVVVKTPVGSE
jgi:hypothetical protein